MRFTIRELVLATVIVAMGSGWWIDHRRQRSAVVEAVADAEKFAWATSPHARHRGTEEFVLDELQRKYGVGPVTLSPGEAEKMRTFQVVPPSPLPKNPVGQNPPKSPATDIDP